MLFYGAIIKSYSKCPCYEYDFNTSVLRRRFYTGVFKQLAVIHAVIRYVLGVINKQVTRFNIIGAFHSMITVKAIQYEQFALADSCYFNWYNTCSRPVNIYELPFSSNGGLTPCFFLFLWQFTV